MGWNQFDRLPQWAKEILWENSLYIDEYTVEHVLKKYGDKKAMSFIQQHIRDKKNLCLRMYYDPEHPDIR